MITYGLTSFHHSENSQLLVFTSFVEFFFTSFFALGLRFELRRTTSNIRVVSSIYFIIFLITNIIFLYFGSLQQFYIIVNGLLILLGALIIYSISKAKQ